MFNRVSSLAIYVTDLERAKRFYTDILGFEIRADLGPTLCFLVSKSGNIDIYLEGGHKPSKVDNETARLSFFLESEKSASETYAALKSAGVNVLTEPGCVGDDTWCFQFTDPDGNVIEVSGKGQ